MPQTGNLQSTKKVITYMNYAYRFWCPKLAYIKKRMEYNIDILTDKEQTIIKQSVKEAEDELNKWFETQYIQLYVSFIRNKEHPVCGINRNGARICC